MMKKHDRRTFTLIELLTVIAVIAILAGLLLPAVQKAKEKAKRTRAHSEIKALEVAIKQYESTYGYLPKTAAEATDAVVTSYTTLLTILGDGGNARGIIFLQLKEGDTFNDPWNNAYQVAMDFGYDGEVDNTVIAVSTTDVKGSVAIWTTDDDGDAITSWGD
jgi:prepilin-type N-terminal cleavage/methylation domain-containing protein